MTREEAWELLTEYNKDEFLLGNSRTASRSGL